MLKSLTLAMCFAFGPAAADEIFSADEVFNPAVADEIFGMVEAVDAKGIINIEVKIKVMVWGVDERSIAQLSEFLIGRWMRCSKLSSSDDIFLGDCGVAKDRFSPLRPDVYLNLGTWLPALGMASPSCSVGDFGNRFSISKLNVGSIQYGCRNGSPGSGMIINF